MNTQQRIDKAIREHAPVSELRAILRMDTTSQLARENEVSHANAMDVHAIDSALASLVERSEKDALAHDMIAAHEMERLETIHEALGRFIRGFQS